MLKSNDRSQLSKLNARRVLAAGAAGLCLGALVAPAAQAAGEGDPMRGGVRNPRFGGSYFGETKVISRNSVFSTRQSNKGTGGGAIYGCRAENGGKGCVESVNLSSGQAFNFRFRGVLGGTITTLFADKSKVAPFTTNATGVATGLNSDKVDGKDAKDITQESISGAAALNKGAVVSSSGAATNQRGVASASKTAVGTYKVVFDAPIDKCVPQVTATADGAKPATANYSWVKDQPTQLDVKVFVDAAAADNGFSVSAIC